MSTPPLPNDLLQTLAEYDTPTICNALEIVAPDRRGFGYTVEALACARPERVPIVGYARTATIRALRPSSLSGDEMRAQRLAYYEYVADGPHPTIAVIQDLDGSRAGYGAFWGEVQSNIHKGLGCLGGVTDGSIRDLDVLADDFQLLAGKIGPSHAYVHLVDIGGTVNVAGMVAGSGDLIHADRHGAAVIPLDVAARIPEAVDLLTRREKVILDAAKAPGFNFEKLSQAMAGAEEIH